MNSLTKKVKADHLDHVEIPETAQTTVWKGDFGRQYSDRNTFDPEALDELYRRNFGLTRREINETFLSDVPKDASFLEVGCNTGNQLLSLQQMGYSNLSGVELQPYAIEIARSRVPSTPLKLGSAGSAVRGCCVRSGFHFRSSHPYCSPRPSARDG